MLPLIMAEHEETHKIVAVHGKEETRRHLANMGFVEGSAISIVSELDGSLIVNVKDARVALGKNLASKIYIE